TVTRVVPGGTVTQRWMPVARVGLYAPGGLAVYPSTVVMNVVPAQMAGVASLVVCSPPQAGSGDRGSLPHPTVLAAAALLGVDEVWAVGGAQAVALLAYGGTDTDGTPLDPVDMVTRPSTTPWRPACWSPTRFPWPTRSMPSCGGRSPPPSTRSGSALP